MRPFSGTSIAAAVLVLQSATFVHAATPSPAAQLFEKLAAPEKADPQFREHLCALLPQPCDKDKLELLQPRGGAAKDLMLVSSKPLAMARVQLDAAGRWSLTALNDFSSYRHSALKGELPRNASLSLAPALYPLAEGRWAVAVLLAQNESYSGGGASFVTADFVPLDSGSGVGTTAAKPGIPFSCSKTVRACFSEKEYKTSQHCHDENDGGLRIAYGLPAKAGEPYGWTFNWSETEWLANKPQKTAKTSRSSFKTAEDAGSKVSFCGGPAE